jgi:hypothetical protein
VGATPPLRVVLDRSAWVAWIATTVTLLARVWGDGGSSDLGDTSYFSRIGRTLISSDWAHTFSHARVQAGVLELGFYGAASQLSRWSGIGIGRLLAPVIEIGVVALLWWTLRTVLPRGRVGRLAAAVVVLLVVSVGCPSWVYFAGHPADAVVPLPWILAGAEAQRGRVIRAGVILGLSANIEL